MENKKNNWTSERKKLLYLCVSIIIIIALLIGLTRAWFYNQVDIEKTISIQPPSDISILGPDNNPMSSIDLNYTKDDKDENGKVTIRRVFCVQSQTDHKIEIVHTTNMKGLTFSLYPATAKINKEGYTDSVVDNGYTYYYNPNLTSNSKGINGKYLNLDKTENDYKYANSNKHGINYENNDLLQTHVEPVYWITNDIQTKDTENETSVKKGDEVSTYYRTYYVCEISWTEEDKETDIFYIMAKNA